MKKIKLFVVILLAFIISVPNAMAASANKKTSLSSFSDDKNPLYLSDYNNETITITPPEGAAVSEWQNSEGRKYKLVKIPENKVSASGTAIKITYPKVGTYEGKDIGLKATYTVYKYRAGANQSIGEEANGYVGIVVAIPYNFSAVGTGFFNSEYEKISYDFFYVSNDTSVDVKNTYMTFNSLNYYASIDNNESIFFGEEMASRISNVYTYEKTNNFNIYQNNGTSPSGIAYSLAISPISEAGPTPQDDPFCDAEIGKECYLYNSASIKYNGKLEYTIGSYNSTTGLPNSAIWYEPSSAIMNGEKPVDPVKYINKTNSRVKKAEYKIGDQVVFEVDQKVNTLKKDILVRYNAFKMIDELPEEVDYVSAKLYDKDGKEVTKGTATYDETAHKVTWTASDEFLTYMPLKGETYTLKVTAKVNSKMKDIATNKAYSIINSYETRKDYATIYTNKETVTVVTVPPTKANTILIGVGATVVVIVSGILIYLFSSKKKKTN
ncbi:MAG: isopeptide-forming domain-containing fimbrial protein [Bacilli bacterium]|nr:isopeptide-forming domain-containing fimbrial protein [Bacilli bacterium]